MQICMNAVGLGLRLVFHQKLDSTHSSATSKIRFSKSICEGRLTFYIGVKKEVKAMVINSSVIKTRAEGDD